MKGIEGIETNGVRSAEASFDLVTNRAETLLGSLQEALEQYSEVTLPSGEVVPAHDEHEFLVAKAQRLLEGVQGLREQMQAENEYHGERAVAMLEAATKHLTEYLAVRADLQNEAQKNAGATRLVEVLDKITLALLPREATNDDAYLVSKENL
jgi:hypothetical protein